MLTYDELLHLPAPERAKLDIALVNLICASGLPGNPQPDIPFCLEKIGRMTERVEAATNRGLPNFKRFPGKWRNSEGIFRIHCMVHVLESEFGVRYNPAKIPEDVPFHAPDYFIHGVLQGDGGTCASMPVLYIAVGRRLGYPLKLVRAQGKYGHFFARWDDSSGERFNAELTHGLGCHPDDYYRSGRYYSLPELEESGTILKSQSADDELADFLISRAGCWREAGQSRRDVICQAWACAMAPHHLIYRGHLGKYNDDWFERLERLKPPHFPPVRVLVAKPAFPPSLPDLVQGNIHYLSVLDNLLQDPRLMKDWWEPMARSWPLPLMIAAIHARYTGWGGYDVLLETSGDLERVTRILEDERAREKASAEERVRKQRTYDDEIRRRGLTISPQWLAEHGLSRPFVMPEREVVTLVEREPTSQARRLPAARPTAEALKEKRQERKQQRQARKRGRKCQ